MTPFPSPSPLIMALLFSGLAGLTVAAARDAKSRIIPNGMVVFVAGVGLALRLPSSLFSIGLSLLAAAIVFSALVFLVHRNMIGGGDAKMIAVATLLVPPDRIVPLLLSIALSGGLLSCFYLGRSLIVKNDRRVARHFTIHLFGKNADRIKAHKSMPYALAILGGAAACILPEVFRCFNAISCSL
ncbi:MAG: prepilin peptidase [Alphaproteobacteria bacterium]